MLTKPLGYQIRCIRRIKRSHVLPNGKINEDWVTADEHLHCAATLSRIVHLMTYGDHTTASDYEIYAFDADGSEVRVPSQYYSDKPIPSFQEACDHASKVRRSYQAYQYEKKKNPDSPLLYPLAMEFSFSKCNPEDPYIKMVEDYMNGFRAEWLTKDAIDEQWWMRETDLNYYNPEEESW